MNVKTTVTGVAVLGGALFLGVSASIMFDSRWVTATSATDAGELSAPQCGHWSVMRCCQLLGVPVEMGAILQGLPPNAEGHSFAELERMLTAVGLQVEGRRETLAELRTGGFPFVAHLTDPDHFLVVAGFEGQRLSLFDCAGRRSVWTADNFERHWSGKLLRVQRANQSAASKRSSERNAAVAEPVVGFETLLIDKGEIASFEGLVPFEFAFHNDGTKELAILDVGTTCACTKAEFPDAPVAPGASGMIRLLYDMGNERGPFMHYAHVTSNDSRHPVITLTVAGNTQTEVIVQPLTLGLGEIAMGSVRRASCFVHYAGDMNDFQIIEAHASSDSVQVDYGALTASRARQWLGIDGNVEVPGRVYVVEVSVAPQVAGKAYEFNDTIEIRTNVPGFDAITVPVAAEVVLPVAVRPSVLFVPRPRFGDAFSDTVQAYLVGGQDFRVVGVDTGTDWIRSIGPDPRQSHDGNIDLTFSVLKNALPAQGEQSVTIDVHIQMLKSGHVFSVQLEAYMSALSFEGT